MVTAKRASRASEGEPSRRQLARLKWLTTLIPTLAIFLFETARHALFDRGIPTLYGNLLVGLLALALAYGFSEFVFGIVIRLQDRTVARSREVAALQAVVEERERISHELHDGLAQLISYMLVRLDTVAELLATARLREAAAELERLRASADDLYVEVRESIAGLRAGVREVGLAQALRDYLEEFEERHGIVVEFQAGALPREQAPLAVLQLFRIVQEALSNVRKHADARHVWITCGAVESDMLRLVIEDDGRGYEPPTATRAEPRAFGLAIMRERTASLGGTFSVEPRPGGGTRVAVHAPLNRVTKEYGDGRLAVIAR